MAKHMRPGHVKPPVVSASGGAHRVSPKSSPARSVWVPARRATLAAGFSLALIVTMTATAQDGSGWGAPEGVPPTDDTTRVVPNPEIAEVPEVVVITSSGFRRVRQIPLALAVEGTVYTTSGPDSADGTAVQSTDSDAAPDSDPLAPPPTAVQGSGGSLEGEASGSSAEETSGLDPLPPTSDRNEDQVTSEDLPTVVATTSADLPTREIDDEPTPTETSPPPIPSSKHPHSTTLPVLPSYQSLPTC